MSTNTEIDWEKVKHILAEDKLTLTEKIESKLTLYPETKTILLLLAAGCVLSLAVLAPGALPLVGVWKSFNKRRFRQNIYHFQKQKYVEIETKGEDKIVKITVNGLKKVLAYKINAMKIHEPEKWDGKWRIVIFDIKDEYRLHRDKFRNQIKSLGLYRLQKSVYVYPFPCFDQIEFIRQIFGVGIAVKYIIAEKVEDDEKLRNYFRV